MIVVKPIPYDSENGRFPPTLAALKRTIYEYETTVYKLQANHHDARPEKQWLGQLRGKLRRTMKEALR